MASPEVLDSSGTMDSLFSDELSAPEGWTKKLMPRKSGTSKRKDVVYIAPDGEEIKNKKMLDKYLKVHPGGASSADFDWSTGETPRRSARLSSKGRLSSDSTDAEPVPKRSRRNLDDSKEGRPPGSSTTPSRRGRKSQPLADTTGKDEAMEEAAEAQKEGATEVPSEAATKKEKKGDEQLVEDGVKAADTGNDSKEDSPGAGVESAGQPTNQLEFSEEPGSVAVKVIAEEQVLTAEGTSLEDVTTDTVMKETATSVEEEKVVTAVLDADVTEVGVPLNITAGDAVEEVTKFPEGETSLKDNLDVEEKLDCPQILEGKVLDIPVVNCGTKGEDSLKPKDHVEPQGIHALIEEPLLCGVNKPDQATESPLHAERIGERRRDKLRINARKKVEKQNKGSSNVPPGEGVDESMRPRESWNATDSSHILAVKSALHLSAVPDTILCRESEQASVIDFCRTCVVEQRSGSIYICGCPGTGKSLTMEKVRLLCDTWSAKAGTSPPEIVALNCTTLTDPRHIYLKVVQGLDPAHDGGDTSSGVSKLKELRKLVCHTSDLQSLRKMLLLIVDEMDYLITRDQSVLYDLFRLPSLANSRCILVGIANAIDLTDRLLPNLRALNCKVDVITFPAYTKEQILKVLRQRLQGLPYVVFKEAALELCARKVAAATGDMRKALHVCRSAVDIVESEFREEKEDTDEVARTLAGDDEGSSGAAKLLPTERKMPEKSLGLVGLDTMALALSRIFRSPVVETIQSLPRHQQMVLCAAVHRFRRAKKDATLGELNTAYVEFCKSMGMQTLTAPEFSSICQVLADQALFNLGANREDRLRRVTLKVDQDDVIFALQGLRFFGNCLNSL